MVVESYDYIENKTTKIMFKHLFCPKTQIFMTNFVVIEILRYRNETSTPCYDFQ